MPPTNDDFANAITLTGDGGASSPVVIDTATNETGEPTPNGHTIYQSIWYKWTATFTDTVCFHTYGSTGDVSSTDVDGNLDTRLAVYTGTALNNLVLVDYNDDGQSGIYYSILRFAVAEGTTYYIQVGTYGTPYSGTLILNWARQIPSIKMLDARGLQQSGASWNMSYPDVFPICSPGDYLIVFAGCIDASSDATMDISGTWDLLAEFRLTDHSSPFTNGGYFKAWGRIATSYAETASITLDSSRSGVMFASVYEPFNTSLTVVATPIVNSKGTSFTLGPQLNEIRERYACAVLLEGGAGSSGVTASGTFNAYTGSIINGSGGTGIHAGTFVHYTYQYRDNPSVYYEENLIPSSYTMPLVDGDYAPNGSILIGFYADETQAAERYRSWQIGAQAPNETLDAGQGAWDGDRYIYRLGRTPGASYNPIFQRYDILTDSWDTLQAPGTWRLFHGSAVMNGKVYIFCGATGDPGNVTATDTLTTLVYDIAGDSWSTGATRPGFVVGELAEDITTSTTTFNIDENVSTLVTDGNGCRIIIDSEAMTITNRSLVSGTTYEITVTRHSSGTSAASHSTGATIYGGWKGTATTYQGYCNYPAAVYYSTDDLIYVWGGFGSGSNEPGDNSFWSFDGTNWAQLDPMPAGQDQGVGVIASDKLHCFGTNIDGVDENGYVYPSGSSGQQLNAHQVYDFVLGQWDLFANLPNPDAYERNLEIYQGVAAYSPALDEIWVLPYQNTGNEPGTAYANDKFVYKYNVSGDIWYIDENIDSFMLNGFIYDHSIGVYYNNTFVFMWDDAFDYKWPGILLYPPVIVVEPSPVEANNFGNIALYERLNWID